MSRTMVSWLWVKLGLRPLYLISPSLALARAMPPLWASLIASALAVAAKKSNQRVPYCLTPASRKMGLTQRPDVRA